MSTIRDSIFYFELTLLAFSLGGGSEHQDDSNGKEGSNTGGKHGEFFLSWELGCVMEESRNE